MKIINKAPTSIEDCELYKLLILKSKGSPILLEKVQKIIEITTPMLNMVISGPFKNYTLHNSGHAKKLVHLASNIVDDTTKQSLTSLDIAMFIYCAYIHDVGMSVTVQERENLVNSRDYLDFIQDSEDIANRIALLREKYVNATEEFKTAYELELFQMQEYILSEILRRKHASRTRYNEIIKTIKTVSGRNDLFEFNNASFESTLIDICESHNLPALTLGEIISPFEARFPRDLAIGGEYINVQFCSALLRITDILDFDIERTPRILFDSLGIAENDLPGAEISLKEWQKHMAIHTIEINDNELIISGDSNHPSIEASINQFANIIQSEIQDTLSILKINSSEIANKYKLLLPFNVRTRISAIGYVFHDLKLHLNEEAVMTLLMGEQLYASPNVALRELLQNSIDACKVLKTLAGKEFIGKIHLRIWEDENKRSWLEVKDNGIGMDNFVISEYLFKVGSSYYRSSDFKRLIKDDNYTPISRFGIGLISVFMISDLLKITTSNKFSTRGDIKERQITINSKRGLAFITESDSANQGTTINLRLKNDFSTKTFIRNLENYLETVIVRPDFPINIELEKSFILDKRYIELDNVAVLKAEQDGIKYFVLDLKRYSNKIEGYVIFPFAIDGDKLVIMKDGKLLSFDENKSINPHDVFINYPGNRITVNGFKMGLKRTHRIFGKRLKFAYDINLIGDNEVKYDVARDKIIGKGSTITKIRLKDSIIAGLKETGIFDKLNTDTQNYIMNSIMFQDGEFQIVDTEKLEEIIKLIPDKLWPIGLHHEIATKLNLSPKLIRDSITYLLDNNLIPDGRRQ